jgi:hypothetical protein
VNADERQEIAASVAANAELGPRYEAAVAEGLVERIGEEIDRRVDARLRGAGHPAPPPQPTAPPPMPHHGMPVNGMPLQPTPPPPGVPWPMPQQGPVAPPVQHGPPHRSGGATLAGVFVALGSMGLGVGATAVLASHVHQAFAQVVTILLVWVAIVVINGVHARFYWPEGIPPRRHR